MKVMMQYGFTKFFCESKNKDCVDEMEKEIYKIIACGVIAKAFKFQHENKKNKRAISAVKGLKKCGWIFLNQQNPVEPFPVIVKKKIIKDTVIHSKKKKK